MMASKRNMAPTEPVVEDMYGVVSPFVEENFLNLDEFLDLDSFPEGAVTDDNAENNHEINNKNTTMHTCDSSTVTDSRNSPPMGANDFGRNASATFDIDSLEANQENTGMLCIPQDDLTDLEWFPFMGNTFSAPKPPPTPTPTFIGQRGTLKGGKPLIKPKVEPYLSDTSPAISALEVSSKTKSHQKKPRGLAFGSSFIVPGKARSKRPRTPVCNWSTRIVSPTSSATSFEHCRSSSALSSDSDYFAESSTPASKKMKFSVPTRSPPSSNENVIMRKCSHCETTKTPQWRTGPKGPKTLCNACGVRYKSGRLVPEYRPASSPTYIPTRHSNSHRKVMEIRKNKELGISKERPLKLKARNNQSNMPVYSVINQTKPNQASSPNPVYSVITTNNSEQEYLHHNHRPASFSFGYNDDVFVDKDAAAYLPHMKHQDSSSFRHMI